MRTTNGLPRCSIPEFFIFSTTSKAIDAISPAEFIPRVECIPETLKKGGGAFYQQHKGLKKHILPQYKHLLLFQLYKRRSPLQ